jgi:hypothetical protein
MTLHQTHVYSSDVIIDHAQWRSKKEKAVKTVVSFERVEPFASKTSKRCKIVTIGSLKAFLKFRSSSVVDSHSFTRRFAGRPC